MKKYLICLCFIIVSFSLVGCSNNTNESNVVDNTQNSSQILESVPSNEEIISTPEVNNTVVEEKTLIDLTNLENKTYAWGFRRMKNGARPEFTKSYSDVLDNYQGIYCGNSEEKVIYLTFDEGYENGYTGAILDTLKEKEAPATFFVTKPYVKQNLELVQRMIDEGHIVGNHTVNHPSMPSVTDNTKLENEIMGLHEYVLEKCNYEMTFLRPPKGEYSERTVALSLNLGYRTVLWSSAYADWDVNNQKGTEYAKEMILNNLHNGSVILLHAVSKDNMEVLGEVIDEIRNRGYEIKPLTEFK